MNYFFINLQQNKLTKNNFVLKKNVFLIVFSILLIALIYSCAKVVAPTGGEKDEFPPIVLQSKPENNTINFNSDKIIIKFDEYLQLKNVKQELLVSPMQNEDPEIKLRGKDLIIVIKDTLDDNITYNFNFSGAIIDLNEGNVFKYFQYAFSTGTSFDTLFVIGHVYNSFNLEPEVDVFVMLYKNNIDTLPQTQKPYYITKTDEEGAFTLNNLHEGSYKVFALKDANRNYMFDQPSEPIAFVDTLITPKVKVIERSDTFSIFNAVDSVYYDSVAINKYVVPAINELHMMLFVEDYKKQFIIESSRKEQRKFSVFMNRSLTDSLKISSLSDSVFENNLIYEANKTHDSIYFWIADSNAYLKDTLIYKVIYNDKDSLEQIISVVDTINFVFINDKIEETEKKPKRKKKDIAADTIKIQKPSELSIAFNLQNFSYKNINQAFCFTTKFPLQNIDTAKIYMFEREDTITVPVSFVIKQDSILKRKFFIDVDFIPEFNYSFIIDSAALKDVYENINDSTGISFNIKKEEDFGNVKLKITNFDYPGILQLLNKDEIIIRENFIMEKDTLIEFNYLVPKNYLLKYIYDKNGDKKWNTGDYIKHIQPESLFYYNSEIVVKESWDYEIEWDIKREDEVGENQNSNE